jgi:hypothetical protein
MKTMSQLSRRIRYIERKLERPHLLSRKRLAELKADHDRYIRMLPKIGWVSTPPLNGGKIKVDGTLRRSTN